MVDWVPTEAQTTTSKFYLRGELQEGEDFQRKKTETHCLHIGRRHLISGQFVCLLLLQIGTHKAYVCWIDIRCELLQCKIHHLNLRDTCDGRCDSPSFLGGEER